MNDSWSFVLFISSSSRLSGSNTGCSVSTTRLAFPVPGSSSLAGPIMKSHADFIMCPAPLREGLALPRRGIWRTSQQGRLGNRGLG